MKCTTEFQKAIAAMPNRIDEGFIISKGFLEIEHKPLFIKFQHSKNNRLYCIIGTYGEFTISELHWCNDEVVREFSAINSNLTRNDFDIIVSYLRINTLTLPNNSTESDAMKALIEGNEKLKSDFDLLYKEWLKLKTKYEPEDFIKRHNEIREALTPSNNESVSKEEKK